MAQDQDSGVPKRPGGLSALALLAARLFTKRKTLQSSETEFLNSRDGYELGRFAQAAFGGDSDAKREGAAAVAAEQAKIDALLDGVGDTHKPVAADPRTQLEQAVDYIQRLRSRGLTLDTLAEALIVIESRELQKKKGAKKA